MTWNAAYKNPGNNKRPDEFVQQHFVQGSGKLGVRIGRLTNSVGHEYVRAYLANLDPIHVPAAIADMREIGWPSKEAVDALEHEFDRGVVRG